VYKDTLTVLQKMPASAAYRVNVEALTNGRLSTVEKVVVCCRCTDPPPTHTIRTATRAPTSSSPTNSEQSARLCTPASRTLSAHRCVHIIDQTMVAELRSLSTSVAHAPHCHCCCISRPQTEDIDAIEAAVDGGQIEEVIQQVRAGLPHPVVFLQPRPRIFSS